MCVTPIKVDSPPLRDASQGGLLHPPSVHAAGAGQVRRAKTLRHVEREAVHKGRKRKHVPRGIVKGEGGPIGKRVPLDLLGWVYRGRRVWV